MREYITPAIVLAVREHRESDRIADLFTRDLGRIRARVPGGSKILSKFSPHLSVLNIVTVRLVQKHSFTITDVARINSTPVFLNNARRLGGVLNFVLLLRAVLPHNEPDLPLWHYTRRSLSEGVATLTTLLGLVGYDSRTSQCEHCGKIPAKTFLLSDHSFLCDQCRVHERESNVLLIN